MAITDTGVDISDGTTTVYLHSVKIEYDGQKTGSIDFPIPNTPTGAQSESRVFGDMGMRNRLITINATIDVNSETNASDASDARDSLLDIWEHNGTVTLNIQNDTTYTCFFHKVKIMWRTDDTGTASTPPIAFDVIITLIDKATYLSA